MQCLGALLLRQRLLLLLVFPPSLGRLCRLVLQLVLGHLQEAAGTEGSLLPGGVRGRVGAAATLQVLAAARQQQLRLRGMPRLLVFQLGSGLGMGQQQYLQQG